MQKEILSMSDKQEVSSVYLMLFVSHGCLLLCPDNQTMNDRNKKKTGNKGRTKEMKGSSQRCTPLFLRRLSYHALSCLEEKKKIIGDACHVKRCREQINSSFQQR